jgi:hypothetical protein
MFIYLFIYYLFCKLSNLESSVTKLYSVKKLYSATKLSSVTKLFYVTKLCSELSSVLWLCYVLCLSSSFVL